MGVRIDMFLERHGTEHLTQRVMNDALPGPASAKARFDTCCSGTQGLRKNFWAE